jgi:DNA repair protein RadC
LRTYWDLLHFHEDGQFRDQFNHTLLTHMHDLISRKSYFRTGIKSGSVIIRELINDLILYSFQNFKETD